MSFKKKVPLRTKSNQIMWSTFMMKNGICCCFDQAARIQSFAWEMGEESLRAEIWMSPDPSGLNRSLVPELLFHRSAAAPSP